MFFTVPERVWRLSTEHVNVFMSPVVTFANSIYFKVILLSAKHLELLHLPGGMNLYCYEIFFFLNLQFFALKSTFSKVSTCRPISF